MKKVSEQEVEQEASQPTAKELQEAQAEQEAYKRHLELEVAILEFEERKVKALVGINNARSEYTAIVQKEAEKMKEAEKEKASKPEIIKA